jgi:dienelactone hydrolase
MSRPSIVLAFILSTTTAAQGQGTEPLLAPERQGRIDFLSGPHGAATTPIWGHLALPPGGARVPAMVLMHGSAGLNPGSRAHYSELLNRHGIAAFYVDSFTGRGIRSSVSDQAVLSILNNTRDAFHALALLRRHPRVDRARIGVMGFSRGGTVSWASAIRDGHAEFRRAGLNFALHVPYYPGCNFAPTRPTTGAPMLYLLGAADNWTRAEHCLDFVRFHQRTNPRIEARVYPGAHHAWDSPAPDGRAIPIPNAQNVTGCATMLTEPGGGGLDPKTGRRVTKAERDRALAACRKSSTVTVQASRAIRSASDGDLIAFLRRYFGI